MSKYNQNEMVEDNSKNPIVSSLLEIKQILSKKRSLNAAEMEILNIADGLLIILN